jgi:hypothetical protein
MRRGAAHQSDPLTDKLQQLTVVLREVAGRQRPDMEDANRLPVDEERDAE